ncbi:unnamed protein product [Paramecium octaurelia]|uniref:UBC core domain-containing protein n=1 Tax=Paramecium octaurelia TaxID=43137 RepID=A0A8S1S955_PAROT|nr:unnamed protein product [Paramecium octaurelia]
MQNRIQKELEALQTKNPLPGISVSVDPNNRLIWHAIVEGPEGSPYEGGKFKLDIDFPENYPFKCPWVYFTTKVFHPCVTEKGNMKMQYYCENEWQPNDTVGNILQRIQKKFIEFKIDNLNGQAEKLYKHDREKFNFIAREETKKYA